MQMSIDDTGPIIINTVKYSNGQINTEYREAGSMANYFYGEDHLTISIRKTIKSIEVANLKTAPLITTEESFSIFAIQETIRDSIKNRVLRINN